MSDLAQFTVAKRALLAKYVRGSLTPALPAARIIPRRAPGSPVPLSLEQQQLWPLAHALRDVPVFTECVTLRIPGPLDVAAFERSFSEIVRRHEAWRTSFPVVNGQPVQIVHPAEIVKLLMMDLRDLPEDEREAEALRGAAEEARRPFDLAQGPLVRATLVQFGAADHRLYLTLHYLIFDGVTLYCVLLPELRALYEAFASGRSPQLAELPIQYADYSLWEREWLRADTLAGQLAYWTQQLAGAPESLVLPTDHPRPAVKSYRGAMHPFALSQDLTTALKALSRREGVTLFMTLLAAFDALLYRYTGQADIVVGTRTAGRKRPEVQGLMGYFLHILPLRTSLADDPTFREVLARAREATVGAVGHEDVPFDYLLEHLQVEQYPCLTPLFQVVLTLEPPLSVLPSGWTVTQMDVETGTSKYDLYLELDDRPEALVGRFEYSTDLFDSTTIARLTGHWRTMLEGIVADPAQRLSQLPLEGAHPRQPSTL